MKKIIVTPAGREQYLSILLNYLIRYKDQFDEWHLWANTTNVSDLSYMQKIALEHPWIKVLPLIVPHEGSYSIHSFFSIDSCDPEAVYIRLDDDIIYIEEKSIETLFKFRMDNREPFLVLGNIVNNGICNHIHQRIQASNLSYSIDYSCMGNSWYNPSIAIDIHKEFLKNYFKGNISKYSSFDSWVLNLYERFSINVISWLGATFKEFQGIVKRDEEQWLSVDKPASIKAPNVICGKTLFAHYAFYTQRGTIDETNILSKYEAISRNY